MGQYIVIYTETAIKDLQEHKKAGNKTTIYRITTIVAELQEHPYTGVGHPEQLNITLAVFGREG